MRQPPPELAADLEVPAAHRSRQDQDTSGRQGRIVARPLGSARGIGTAIAIPAAVLAGCFLSLTGLLQQRAASSRPEGESLSPRLLVQLARNRVWLLGLGAGFVAYGFQALALAFGALALVQPIFLSELIFAVPISVRLHKLSLGAREWGGILAVVGGLAIGIAAAGPRRGDPLPAFVHWAVALGIVTVVVAAALGIGRRLRGPVRASLYAAAGACVLAFQSALFNAAVDLFKHDIVSVFTHWQSYALVPVTAAGVLLVQSAYQAGPLAASMPVMDAVLPCVAIALGVALFHESVHTSALNLAGTAVGLGLFLTGILLLDTSPVVHRLQRREDERKGDDIDLSTLREDAQRAGAEGDASAATTLSDPSGAGPCQERGSRSARARG